MIMTCHDKVHVACYFEERAIREVVVAVVDSGDDVFGRKRGREGERERGRRSCDCRSNTFALVLCLFDTKCVGKEEEGNGYDNAA